MSVSFNFGGKKVLVTGASRGIGRAICIAFSDAGAHVYGLARDGNALSQLAAEKSNVTPIVGDMSSSAEELKKLIEQHQPFDYLVNNAGIASLQTVGEITAEVIDQMFAVNYRGPLLLAQIVSKAMIDHKVNGAIVNVSSQAGIRPLESHTVYCSTKAALDMATRCLALELGPKGIRVNSVNPTVVMTEMGKKAWGDKEKAEGMLAKMSLKHFAEETDVVTAVLFLLSNGSALTTGMPFTVDGGFCHQ